MGARVAKFGGTSLADASQFRKVKKIIESDNSRRYIVPSAPGKRSKDDRKVTDLLYLSHEAARQGVGLDAVFDVIIERYQTIISDLGLDLDLSEQLDNSKAGIIEYATVGKSADFAASRGEYLNGHIVAAMTGATFVDAAEVIFFKSNGRLDEEKTNAVMTERTKDLERAVIPGFYGQAADGSIKTFSRGGSDITGAIVARAVGADVYENWTDVSGLLMADPRIVDNPRPIDVITYNELRELAYMGATVLHDEAIFPVRKAGIPVNIRNTNEAEHPGSMIVSEAEPITHRGTISGVAGRKGFTIISLEKTMMNAEVGFGRKLLQVFENFEISYEHSPTGIDTMGVVVADAAIDGRLDALVDRIKGELEPDEIDVDPNLALIATVGRGMARTPGIAGKLFKALADADVNIRMIDQGSSEINIIVGVDDADLERGLRAIYQAFVD